MQSLNERRKTASKWTAAAAFVLGAGLMAAFSCANAWAGTRERKLRSTAARTAASMSGARASI